jgi:hypothetical protein
MMPMVDGFATLEQKKRRTVCDIAKSFFLKTRRKILKKDFVRANLYDKALFNKKN